MKQKHALGIVALAMVAILGVSMVSAFGFGDGFGLMKHDLSEDELADMQAQQEAMQTAIENSDYSTWKSLMEQRITMMQEQLAEENFNHLVEQHKEMQEFREAMQEARSQFCEENDCPNFGDGGFMNDRGPRHMSQFRMQFADPDSE